MFFLRLGATKNYSFDFVGAKLLMRNICNNICRKKKKNK